MKLHDYSLAKHVCRCSGCCEITLANGQYTLRHSCGHCTVEQPITSAKRTEILTVLTNTKTSLLAYDPEATASEVDEDIDNIA